MIEYKPVEKTELDISNVLCDCCGKSCYDGNINFEYMTMQSSWGYYSNKDLETWTAQICEKCVDEKFGFINFQKQGLIRQ
jgi:hypothetical protein